MSIHDRSISENRKKTQNRSSFVHKKTKYENIYQWAQSDEGNCFYCKELKGEIPLRLLGEKGICQSCLDGFEIGNLAVDRHVVQHIHPEFHSHTDARDWFATHAKLVFTGVNDTADGSWYLYDFIQNESQYDAFHNQLETTCFVTGLDHLSAYTRLEISEDGRIHIVY